MRATARTCIPAGMLVASLCFQSSGYSASAPLPESVRGEAAAQGSDSHIQRVVGLIQSESSVEKRRQHVQDLALWIAGPMPRTVSDGDIDAMAALMRDPDDAIRGRIAGALGKLGARAQRAVPELVQALRERPCENQPLASADAIRLAIKRIGAEVPNVPCTDPFGS